MAPCLPDFSAPRWHLFLILSSLQCLPHSICSDTDFQGPNSFRIILTTSFYNRSWTQNLGSAWLDGLQTHGWDSKTGILIHLRPWSKGNFSNRELMEQERSLHAASIAFPLIFQNHVSQWQLECELGSLRTGGMEVAGVCRLEFLLPPGKCLPLAAETLDSPS